MDPWGPSSKNGTLKSKLLSKIETFFKSKLLSKIKTFFLKNPNFCQKHKLLSKIETFVKNRNFLSEKLKPFVLKIETFVKNRNFGPKSKLFSKIKNFWIFCKPRIGSKILPYPYLDYPYFSKTVAEVLRNKKIRRNWVWRIFFIFLFCQGHQISHKIGTDCFSLYGSK